MAKRERDKPQHKARRARHRRRFFIRLLVVAALALAVVLVACNWDVLAPQILVGKISDLFSGGAGNGFPIDISGNYIYQMEAVDGGTVLLSDTYVTLINHSGGELMRRAHAYSQPQLRTAGKYILIAERGGKRVQLQTRAKTLQNLTVDYDIVTTAVHKNGHFALVTGSEQGYNAKVLVYSAMGELLYSRSCSNLVGDVAFSPNGRELALLMVGAKEGAMRSTIEIVSIHSHDSAALYTHSETDVLLCRVQYLSDNIITAVGDTAVWMYHPKKDTCYTYAPADGNLKAFSIGSDSVVTVTSPYGSTAGGNVTYIRTDGTAAFTVAVDGAVRDIAASGNTYALLTGSQLYQIGSKGILQNDAMTADNTLVAFSGGRILVLGLQTLSMMG